MAKTGLPAERLYALDALRGFDMFWIIGGEDIIHGLAKATGSPFWKGFSIQLTHAEWNGFHFYDLIFPLFLFIAGVAIPYSLGRQIDEGRSRRPLLWRVIRRALVLVLLGFVYNNGLSLQPLTAIRFPSVLGRIGLAYMFAAIIYLFTRPARRPLILGLWCCGLLIGYWLLLVLNAAPGFPRGDLSMQGNIVSYVDRSILPGKLYLGIHDPEGVLSTIPAVATGLLGILTGMLMRSGRWNPAGKTGRLALGGLVFMLLGWAWNLLLPVNKNLWSSSFVLFAGGISLLLLALFYYVIDVRGYRRWILFFRVIGMNSILIYMSGQFIDWDYTTHAFFQWLGQWAGSPYDEVLMACCGVGIEWAFLYFLYRKKIFLRV